MLSALVRRATTIASASATASAMAALAAKSSAVLRAASSAPVRAPEATRAAAAASLPAALSVAARAGNGSARSGTSTVSTFLTGEQLCGRPALPLSAAKSVASVDAVNGKKRFSLTAMSARAAATVGLTTPSAPVLPQIDFKVGTFEDPLKFSGDLLVVAVLDSALKTDDKGQFVEFADEAVTKLDQSLGGVLSELASEPDFKGKTGQKTSVVRLLGQGFKRIALLGLGKSEAVTSPETSAWQGVGASIAALAKASQSKSAAVAFVAAEPPSTDADAAAAIAGSIATGAVVGSFSDVRFKSEESDKDKAKAAVESVEIVGFGAPSEASEKALFKAVRLAAGTILTRQLVNAPPNVLTPEAMAQVAVELSQAHADVLSAKILDEAECERLGMGAYLGVAAASENPPKFIHLTYTPPSSGDKEPTKIALIGKGLTFDSGGYNLKAGPGSMIHLMKFDMGGAAAVLGAAKAVAAIQPEGVEVHFIVAACENMVSGKGMRPGDILTASNGKTIEVNNTDAEGRLTLADALVYACKLKVTKIIDVATLTGACIIALGDDIGGLFTPSDEMAKEVSDAAKAAGEKVWRMPMEESYWEQMKSNVADFVNTGGRAGGSITASLFLKRFVDEGVSWAHLDIAGPVWSDKKGGGTGYGAGLLYKWVESNSQ